MPAGPTERVAKQLLRRRLVARRAERSAADRSQAADALASRMSDLLDAGAATTVAAYVSTHAEPGTGPLLSMLHTRGRRVLLPLLRVDSDLDWAHYEPGALRPGRFGLSEPTGEPLGTAAVGTASFVICPALAGDGTGNRLGRGGGSYDRVLGRLGSGVVRVALLYDDEVLDAIPFDDHDQPVQVIVTPTRTLRTTFNPATEAPGD